MCSIVEGSFESPEEKTDFRKGMRPCMKCGEVAVVIIRINDAFCRACFLTYCTHKFRSAFGKSKLIRDGERVLVALSGGPSSTAVLHLIQEGLSKRAQKKLRFIPSLLHINEGAVCHQSAADQEEHCNVMQQMMQKSGLSCHIIHLQQVLEEPGVEDSQLSMNGLSVHDKADQRLNNLLKSCTTLTAKEDIIRRLRHETLVSFARNQGFSKVILGDSATRLSVRLLADIAQGRGAHIPADVGFSDSRCGDVTFVRPLREFTAKEIAMYNRLNDLEPIVQETLATKGGVKASIDAATEAFVSGLQAQFPSTVSTIFRTGDKLDAEFDDSVEICIFCSGVLDTTVPQSSALNATEFSQILSNPGTTGCHSDNQSEACCGEGDGSCKSSQQNISLTKEQLKKVLCYGCRLVVRDMESTEFLPERWLREGGQKLRRSQMKENIQEFLLID